MSKHLYYRERALEDAFRNDVDYDLHGYMPPAQYNAHHGLKGVSRAFSTIPTGAQTTPVDMRAITDPDMRNELLSDLEVKGPALLTLGALAGFFLFLR